MIVIITFVILLSLISELVICKNLDNTQVFPKFSKHSLITPRLYHGKTRNQIFTTEIEGKPNNHVQNLVIDFNENGTDYVLNLSLNTGLLTKDYFHKFQENGTFIVKILLEKEVKLCHYQGKLRDIKNSWVAISTCHNSISGVIFDGHQRLHIEKSFNSDGVHILYKESDMVDRFENNCDNQEMDENFTLKHDNFYSKRHKRSAKDYNVRGPYNENQSSRFVELVIVVDKSLYDAFKDFDSIHHRCQSIVNVVNALYSPLNIFVALVGVEIWNEHDKIWIEKNATNTLYKFLDYRANYLLKDQPNDNAQLLTQVKFVNSVVGEAITGAICSTQKSGGVVSDSGYDYLGFVAETLAHE